MFISKSKPEWTQNMRLVQIEVEHAPLSKQSNNNEISKLNKITNNKEWCI